MAQHVKQPCIVLTGMHRSGTSLAASLLRKAGLNMGTELLEADHGNKEGYFEDAGFVRFHEEVLSSAGFSREGWGKQISVEVPDTLKSRARELIEARRNQAETWGWKDPRTVLFLDFWRQLLPEARFVFICRPPWEVLDSLYRRRNAGDEVFENEPNLAVETYTAYGKAILKFIKQHPDISLVLEAKRLIDDPAFLSRSITRQFAISVRTPDSECVNKAAFHEEKESYRPALIMRFFPEAVEIYRELTTAAGEPWAFGKEPIRVENSEKWILQDWAKSRRAEKLSKALEYEKRLLHQVDDERQKLFGEVEKKTRALREAHIALHDSDVKLYKAARKLQVVEDSVFWKTRSIIIKVLSALKLYRPPADSE